MNKAYLIALITLVGLSALALTHYNQDKNLRTPLMATVDSVCPKPQYRPDAWMNTFLTQVKAIKTDSDTISFLTAQIPTDSHVFSTDQILSIFKLITFDSSRLTAIKLMDPYIVTLTSQNIVSILNQFVFSGNKFDALSAIASTLSDVTDASKQIIVDTFTFSSDKAKAMDILNAVKPRNCIYGTITEKVAGFIIDISGSMDQTFTNNGQTISRLQFVKTQLTQTLAQQLKPYQKFNIIIFSSSATQWKSSYVDATTDNINSAIAYINKLTTLGATNISSGFDLAFNTSENLTGIYLLSDGNPNSGIATIAGIKKYLTDKNANKVDKVHVNCISFIMGGTESQKERDLSFQFLNAIADATNGSFKGITG